jgi:hypothetical protein
MEKQCFGQFKGILLFLTPMESPVNWVKGAIISEKQGMNMR